MVRKFLTSVPLFVIFLTVAFLATIPPINLSSQTKQQVQIPLDKIVSKDKEKNNLGLLGSNAEGKRFIVGFMQNEITDVDYIDRDSIVHQARCNNMEAYMVIQVTSRFGDSVTVYFPANQGNNWISRYDKRYIPPYKIETFDVPSYYECESEGTFINGIEVSSKDHPISVYCYSSKVQTSDGYLALPIDSWGTRYTTANYYVDAYNTDPRMFWDDSLCFAYPRRSEFAIIASEDSTFVQVFPTTPTLAGFPPGSIRMLMKNEIWQLQDGNRSTYTKTDLTGSSIISTKPVGLLSGHVRAGVRGTDLSPYLFETTRDHIIEMLPSTNQLGKKFVAFPFKKRNCNGDFMRIISGASTGQPIDVSITSETGFFNFTLDATRRFQDYQLTEPTYIESSAPILVAQYARSMSADIDNIAANQTGLPAVNLYDPDMVLVTPIEQYVNGAVFQTMPNYRRNNPVRQFNHHYVNLVSETDKFNTLTLNDKPLNTALNFSTWTLAGNLSQKSYTWAFFEVKDNTLSVIKGDCLFSGIVYGVGDADSYAWQIGAGLRKLDVVDRNKPVMRAEKNCAGWSIFATDSLPNDHGLRDVYLDSAYSQNVKIKKNNLISGDDEAVAFVSTIDPKKSGKARVIVKDYSSPANYDTLDLSLEIFEPTLSYDKTVLASIDSGDVRYIDVLITNTVQDTMLIDSVFLDTNSDKSFTLEDNPKNFTILRGKSAFVRVKFQGLERRNFLGRLSVITNCLSFNIDITAGIGKPLIICDSLDFGKVRVGQEKCLKIRVSNPGVAKLRIDKIEIDNPIFSEKINFRLPIYLQRGQDTLITVCFKPTDTLSYKGKIKFSGNADSVAVGELKGIGIYPKLLISGFDFGKHQVGDTMCAKIFIVNSGTDTATITGIFTPVPEGFTIDQSKFPVKLPQGDTLWVDVCYTALREAQNSTDMTLLNEDKLKAMNTLKGSGYTLRAKISGYDWKSRLVNRSYDTVIFISNLMSEPITIEQPYITSGDINEFEILPSKFPATLNAGESYPLPVRFSPKSRGGKRCVINAVTNSRNFRIIDSVLAGYCLEPQSQSSISFNSLPSHSCDSRSGEVRVTNVGNMPIVLTSLQIESSPNVATLVSPPDLSYVIDENQNVIIKFNIILGGYVGQINGKISWTLAEFPGKTFSESFNWESIAQAHSIALSAPPRVAPEGIWRMDVKVDNVLWKSIPREKIFLHLSHNPRMAKFASEEWQKILDSTKSNWLPFGAPKISLGQVSIEFRPKNGASLPLDSAEFPELPFQVFIGDDIRSSISVTLSIDDTVCAPPVSSYQSFLLDSICGLENRLMEFLGPTYKLYPIEPNPASSSIKVKFDIGLPSNASFRIFSLDGKLIRTFIDGYLKDGAHSFNFNISDIPNGSYICEIKSGSFYESTNLVIQR